MYEWINEFGTPNSKLPLEFQTLEIFILGDLVALAAVLPLALRTKRNLHSQNL